MPAMVVVVFITFMTSIRVQENRIRTQNEITTLREGFIAQQKTLIKSQVDQVIQHINYEQRNAEESLKADIQHRIYEAYGIANKIYSENKDKSEADVTKLITDALRTIRFNEGRGYFFIYKTTGMTVMHPVLPQNEGVSKYDLKDIRGNYIVREMGELVKSNGEAFYRWWFVKPQNKTQEFEKIGFGKYFEPYDWFIGTGEYIVDVENDIKKRLLTNINDIRFGSNGYIFIVDFDGQSLSHIRKEYLYTDRLQEQDSNGKFYIKDIIQLAKEGGGYLEYISPFMPSTGNESKKISYISSAEYWRWAVGSGVYVSEIEGFLDERERLSNKQNKEELLKIIALSFLVTVVLLYLSFFVSRRISNSFSKFQQRISDDFAELENNKNQMEYMAMHDALTGLPNRMLLVEQVNQGVALSKKLNKQLALLFLDLDDFKKINDVYGHSAGDELLKDISNAFQKNISEGDTVSRFGGDEFVFCFPALDNLADAEGCVERVRDIFNTDFEINGKVVVSSCSMGVAMYPDDGSDPETLISKADIVLYKSKLNRKGSVLFYNQAINRQVQYDFMLEGELRLALDRNEFYVCYQPQINIDTQEIYGVEALIRWDNKKLGQVSPVEFIGVAEDIGLIHDIGMFVVHKACTDIASYNRSAENSIHLSINISPKQLLESGFAEEVYSVVLNSDLDVTGVTLEITENVLISDQAVVAPVLQQLRDYGFGLSLDDFGTGYSSLSYINNLPFNEIKIDRSFVDKVLINPQSESLVKAIVAIGESCNMTIVAEGVETSEQYARLKELKCGFVQGYFFDKPLPYTVLLSQYQLMARE